jgi:hypothetical protein
MKLAMRRIVNSGRIVLTAEYNDMPGTFVVLTLTSLHGPYQKNDSRFKRVKQKPPADPSGWLRMERMRMACHLIETAFQRTGSGAAKPEHFSATSTVMACSDVSGYSG